MIPTTAHGDEPENDSAIERIDSLMFLDPKLVIPKAVIVVPNDPMSLWAEALSRPEAQLQQVTLDTIAIAHRRGMPGLEKMIPSMTKLLGQTDLDPNVQRAAVHALIEFDSQDQAEMLARLSQREGASVASIVEPALVRWKSKVLANQWLARVSDSRAGRVSMTNAINGLGALRMAEASEPLERLVFDDLLPTGIRMSAAGALGAIHASGLQDQATRLVEQPQADVPSHLLAVTLLSQHDDPRSIEILQSLAENENTTVQSRALGRLFEIDPKWVDELADEAITSRDVNVRRIAARAMIWRKDASRLAPLSTLLNDVNRDFRREIAAAMVKLANKDDLRDEVISEVKTILQDDSWRGCEQAAIILVSLGHHPAGQRLVELLDHQRGEVMVAAAWGLRRFALKEHCPAMLDRAKASYSDYQQGKLDDWTNGREFQIAQLFMAFGKMKYHEAEELMLQFVPKDLMMGDSCRPAAVWALGYLHDGEADEQLTATFIERLNDIQGEFPETTNVRYMSVISIGRMRTESALPELRKNALANESALGLAALWAVGQMTGEEVPTLKPRQVTYSDWFLSPLRDESGAR